MTVADRVEVFPDNYARQTPSTPDAPEASEARFGIALRPVTPAEREERKLDEGQGVLVTRILEDSFAGEIGIQENDVILSINRIPVGSREDILTIQKTLKPGDAVAFRVMRENPMGGRRGVPRFNSFFVSGTLPRN